MTTNLKLIICLEVVIVMINIWASIESALTTVPWFTIGASLIFGYLAYDTWKCRNPKRLKADFAICLVLILGASGFAIVLLPGFGKHGLLGVLPALIGFIYLAMSSVFLIGIILKLKFIKILPGFDISEDGNNNND